MSGIPALELGTLAIREAVKRSGIDGQLVDEVIMGNVRQAGLGQNPARQVSIKAGLLQEVPAWTLNLVCESGLKAVGAAAQQIWSGDAEVVVAGGMENMSMFPYVIDRARWGLRMGDGKIVDAMIKDGLWCAFTDVHMGITAENIAEKYGITREDQDVFSAASQ